MAEITEKVNPHDPVPTSPEDARVRRVEIIISNLLRIGVVSSLAIVVIGLVMTFHNHPDFLSSGTYKSLTAYPTGGQVPFPRTIPQVLSAAFHGGGQGIVLVGLLLLVLTPVMRVAVSIFAFVYQHDRAFVVITSVVLFLLLLSFVLGKAE